MRANKSCSQYALEPLHDPTLDASDIRNCRRGGKLRYDPFRQRLHRADGCAENAQISALGGFGFIGGNGGKNCERFSRSLQRTRPKAQIPFRPNFSQSQGERTANQPRAEDGNRAQGTRKILFV